MPTKFLPDTNILIDYAWRDPVVQARLDKTQQHGTGFVIGPPVLIELVRGLVAQGDKTFLGDQKVFNWLYKQNLTILPLPKPFMAQILGASIPKKSGVEPHHYGQLIETIAKANTFEDFLAQNQNPDSVWNLIGEGNKIHEAELDKEFNALEQLSSRTHNIGNALSRMFGAPGARPNPLIIERRFSAAIEFLQASLYQVHYGARPRKNDPGLYVDFQLLFYLADPEIAFLTEENFSDKIRHSPQRDRIVTIDSLP